MDENQNPEPTPTSQPVGLKAQFTTVTPLSKFLAMALFVALPFVGFWFGTQEAKKEVSNVVYVTKECGPNNENSFSQQVQPPTATEEAKWNVYTNTELGFSFEYPINYEIVSSERKGEGTRNIISLMTRTQKDNSYYSVSVSEIQATTSEALLTKLNSVWQSSVTLNELSIGGFDGVYVINPNGGISGENTYYFIGSGATLEITSVGTSVEPDTVVATLEKIKTEAEVYNENTGM